MFYTVKIPKIVKIIAPSLVYDIKADDKVVYLTFDDGPIPESTPAILDILESFSAKATFFCLGKNVEQNLDLFNQIKQKNHSTGNHSYNHLNGWTTKNKAYFDDIEKADKFINSTVFRPPYGKISPCKIKHLKRKYKIVMWDVLSGDFDPGISVKKCINNVVNNIRPGSIIVFHDNLKAKSTTIKALPEILKILSDADYKFKGIRD